MDSGEIMANNKDQGKMELSSEEKPIDSSASEKENKEKVDFKVVFNKKKFDVTFDMDDTIGALKVHLADIINVPNTMQKVMIKGLAKDEMTLRQVGVTNGSKSNGCWQHNN